MGCNARRGFSLLEVMVAMGIAMLIATAVYQMFTAGLRGYSRAEARVDLQTAGLTALARMTTDLRPSAFALLTVQSDTTQPPVAVSCRVPSANVYVVYYLDASHQVLVRKVWPRWAGTVLDGREMVRDLTALNANLRLPVLQLKQICSASNGTEQKLAQDVGSLTLSTGENVVTLSLGLQTTFLSQPATASVGTTLYLRNKVQ